MFFVLSKIFDVLLSPYSWGLGLLALAMPWRLPRRPNRRRAFRWRRRAAVIGLAILVLFSLEPIANALFLRLEQAATSTIDGARVYDAVVLLGGITDEQVVFETGMAAYNDNIERLVFTHRLLADGRARAVIISGAAFEARFVETGEARVLARQLVAWGIDPSRIFLEEKARNTRENAVYSKEVAFALGFHDVVMVTSAFHMRRAKECFVAVGFPVDTYAVDFRARRELFGGPGSEAYTPRARALAQSTAALHEMAGLWIYRARGYAKPAP